LDGKIEETAMEKRVSSTSSHGKARTEIHKITVEKMKNGFTVKAHRRPVPGQSRDAMMMNPMDADEEPQVFTKHAPAQKAIQAHMSSMHPQLPPGGSSDGTDAPMTAAANTTPSGPVEQS
jgi:hypothetical protein